MKSNPPATQLTLKTILNRVQRFAGFVYRSVVLRGEGRDTHLEVVIEPHAGRPRRCGECLRPCPGYDTLAERRWQFVPLWNLPVWLRYAPRRVACPEHGVVVEHLPWSDGKRPIAKAMMLFLARWARRLSWRETARSFRVSWEAVYRSVEWCVEWGLAHRELRGVTAIGVDEIHRGRGTRAHNFFTLIYQLDAGCRRLLWVGPKRTQATLRRALASLGPEVLGTVRWVCSDMWQPYLQVIARQLGHAWHVLDRFHIVGHLNQALDRIRRSECAQLQGQARGRRLKRMRWRLLRNHSRVRGHARRKLHSLVRAKLATGRALGPQGGLLGVLDLPLPVSRPALPARLVHPGPAFPAGTDAEGRQDAAPPRASHPELVSRQGRTLQWRRRRHEQQDPSGPRRSYGFRTDDALVLALYHNLGRLPEPQTTHEFC